MRGRKKKGGAGRPAGRRNDPAAEAERERVLGPKPWAGFNHNNIACRFLAMDSLELAISEFREAVRLNPWKAIFKVNLARAYIRAGELKKAGALLAEAAEREPSLPEGFFAAGMLLEARGLPEKAAGAYESCLAACPEGAIRRQAAGKVASLRRKKRGGA
jgi:tetratricopeptide (TPR) repeat protein